MTGQAAVEVPRRLNGHAVTPMRKIAQPRPRGTADTIAPMITTKN